MVTSQADKIIRLISSYVWHYFKKEGERLSSNQSYAAGYILPEGDKITAPVVG
jgi:hypothetical protein